MPSEYLECLIGATRVDVPLADVERLLEYQAVLPPPLAELWLGGIGLDSVQQELFLSICLPGRPAAPSRDAQGLLFRRGGGPRWALEVDRVVGLRALEAHGELQPVAGWACPDHWLRRGRADGGDLVRWLDVSAASRSLEGGDAEDPRA